MFEVQERLLVLCTVKGKVEDAVLGLCVTNAALE